MSDLIGLVREQKKIELGHVRALRPTMKSVSNRLASALLESIVHDSRKHAGFLSALIDIKTSQDSSAELDVGESVNMLQAVEEHIKVEEEMINRLEAMLKQPLDGWTRAILTNMLSDERRHHSILQGMSDLFSRGEPQYEDYFGLAEKYMYQGPDHGHKARQF